MAGCGFYLTAYARCPPMLPHDHFILSPSIESRLMPRITSFYTSLALLLLCSAQTALAQHQSEQHARVATRGKKSVSALELKYTQKLDSLINHYSQWRYEEADTLSNPYYAALFGSPTLYNNILARCFGKDTTNTRGMKPQLASSAHVYELLAMSDSMLTHTYAFTPWLVKNEEAVAGTVDIVLSKDSYPHPKEDLKEEFEQNEKGGPTMIDTDDWHVVVRRPNFWTFSTNFSLQFTQNYVSDNWYKGGESHNALLAATTIRANYNNQQKVTFENTLEMKLGFQSSHNDDEHKYKTNSDLLRLTNKLGLRAVKNWYYTVMLQSWTQFYKGYKSNDKKVYSDFMSPFESLLSVGMDYQLKKKKFNISATVSPIALKLKYVGRPSLETSFGLTSGHHSKWDYGSNITVNYKWDILNNLSWQGRIYYFTDYSKTQVEWENTFNFTFNKYLSTRLFLYPRFDDSRKRKEGESYFQFNELLSLGLNVNF